MPFDLNNLNPPVRFFWPGDEKGEEWVELRVMVDADQLKFVKEVGIDRKQAFKVNPLSKKMERVEYVDANLAKDEAFAYKIFDHTIAAWYLRDPDGAEITCSFDNKVLLMTRSREFRVWVDECLATLEKDQKIRAEKSEKNSTSSQLD